MGRGSGAGASRVSRQSSSEVLALLAEVAGALANPHRLRALHLLAQSPRPVDALAELLGQSVANTSAHLQVLRRAHLVGSTRRGRRVVYELARPEALRLWLALVESGLSLHPELRELIRRFDEEPGGLETLRDVELLERMSSGAVFLVDLRPAEEFARGHVPGAVSVPAGEASPELVERLRGGGRVVAYCRGPFCVGAVRGTSRLRELGVPAVRLREGVEEWEASGRPLAVETTTGAV